MQKVATSLSLLLLAAACGSTERGSEGTTSAAHQLAVACQVTVDVARAALAGDATADPLPDPGTGSGSGSGDPGTGSGSGSGSGDPPGDGNLDIACCTDPDGCTPMDYPDDTCSTMPTPVEADELALHSLVPYYGDGTTTAYFGNCEEPTGTPQCDEEEAAYVFQPYPETRWVAAFIDDGAGNAIAELYSIPAGTTSLKIPGGAQVFPLLEEGHGFADLTRPVETPDGTRYVDLQNDCIPRPDGCGFTCFTC